MNQPVVGIVILNWNGWRDTIECLESLSKINYPNYRIILVDNGSAEESVKNIEEWKQKNKNAPLTLLRLEKNLGFARGNNVGIKQAAEADLILILNNDTIVDQDFLSVLVDCLQKDGKAALAAPRVIDYYTGKFWQKPIPWPLITFTYIIWATQLYRFFSRFIFLSSKRASRIYEAPGCCLLIKKKIFEAIGCFDENTFLGWEEFIIAQKLFRKGYLSYFAPQSRIYHKIGRSTDKIGSLEKIRVFTASEAYFQEKILRLTILQIYIIRTVRVLIYSFMLLLGERRAGDLVKFIRMLAGGKLWRLAA